MTTAGDLANLLEINDLIEFVTVLVIPFSATPIMCMCDVENYTSWFLRSYLNAKLVTKMKDTRLNIYCLWRPQQLFSSFKMNAVIQSRQSVELFFSPLPSVQETGVHYKNWNFISGKENNQQGAYVLKRTHFLAKPHRQSTILIAWCIRGQDSWTVLTPGRPCIVRAWL